MFQDQYRRANDNIHAGEGLYEKVKRGQRTPVRNKRLVQAVAAVLALALLGGGAWGLIAASKSGPILPQVVAIDPANPQPIALQLSVVSDYDDLYVRMQLRTDGLMNDGGLIRRNTMVFNVAPLTETAVDMGGGDDAAPMPDPAPTGAPDYAGETQKDYSDTNKQVGSVDEADIVKTDGDYIYVLSPEKGKLYAVSADGADMKVTDTVSFTSKKNENENIYAQNMYVYGDRLFVILSYDAWGVIRPLTEELATDAAKIGGTLKTDDNRTQVVTYDISDRNNIKKLSEISQSGYYSDSRLTDGYLYIVTSYYNWNWIEGAPITYCPTLRDDSGRETLIPAGDILIYEDSGDTSYSVIGAIDCDEGSAYTSTKALFGVTGNIYCDGPNLLLTSYAWQNGYTEEKRDETASSSSTTTAAPPRMWCCLVLTRARSRKRRRRPCPAPCSTSFLWTATTATSALSSRAAVSRSAFTPRASTPTATTRTRRTPPSMCWTAA